MKMALIIGMVVGFALSGLLLMKHNSAAAPAMGTQSTTLPDGTVRPSDVFLHDFDEYVSLSSDVVRKQHDIQAMKEVKDFQAEQDRATGMGVRLQQQVPQGWTFDAKTRLLLPPKPATPPPAPPTTPAASPNTKGKK